MNIILPRAPWDYHSQYEIVTPRGTMLTVIAQVNSTNEQLPPEEVNSIGNAIAALPDLIDALEEMLALEARPKRALGYGPPAARKKALLALRKVRGES